MLDWLGAVLAPILVFGLVVFVHELGHFLAAKAVGVYAPRFSIGFGPALWSRRWGETEYVIAAIPLGGYVRMASREDETMALIEGGGEKPPEAPTTVGGSEVDLAGAQEAPARTPKNYDPNALVPFGPRPVPEHSLFESKSLPARLLIMIAGVTMNMLLGFVVLAGLFAHYGRPVIPTRAIGAVRPLPSVPQLVSQLQAGDTILAVGGRPVETWNEVVAAIDSGVGDQVSLRTQRTEVVVAVGGPSQPTREQLISAIQPLIPPVVDQVVPSAPAERAGLRAGDSVVAVAGRPVRSWAEVVEVIEASPGKTLMLEVVRDGQLDTLSVRPDSTPQADPATGRRTVVGKIGAAVRPAEVREPIAVTEAVAAGWRSTWALAGSVITVVQGLVTGAFSLNQLGGPIAIARASAAAAQSGLERLLELLAFLSINVAVLNLLPIPILDGGQIVLNLVEAARGAAFSARTREYIVRVGVLAIALLFVLVMFNDIKNLLGVF